jgi:hypothetical protein
MKYASDQSVFAASINLSNYMNKDIVPVIKTALPLTPTDLIYQNSTMSAVHTPSRIVSQY